jgi:hypothetical protein
VQDYARNIVPHLIFDRDNGRDIAETLDKSVIHQKRLNDFAERRRLTERNNVMVAYREMYFRRLEEILRVSREPEAKETQGVQVLQGPQQQTNKKT